MVSRIYVEKKLGFDTEAQQIKTELTETLGITNLEGLRVLNRYDVEGIDKNLFDKCVPTVFSEPQVDDTYTTLPKVDDGYIFAVEYHPGQFDQRADSASQCIQLISQTQRPPVRTAKVYILEGNLSSSDIQTIKNYVINPVESREASLDIPESVSIKANRPDDVEVLDGFIDLDEDSLNQFIQDRGLAMDIDDIKFFQNYFKSIDRNPTITEVKMVDTYWSDHCRHTTFHTNLDNVVIDDDTIQKAFDKYLNIRKELDRDNKPVCLMDMGTLGAKYLEHKNILTTLDKSEEINACTVKEKVDVNGEEQDWLFLFKNETHNHPTEIEPFGGAATCIGGAIRDPLSGRSYVYQAMRVTGAANPLTPIKDTIEGKLPQRKLVQTAAAGYSSYGNQIGLATGQVNEIYHPGYAAKRMEIGAVVGATPESHVRRECPLPGDVIVLLGGKTGRDGIGGATGSSKAHNIDSLESCGAEVQKGNAPIERKLQRLFRRGDACKLIKRCNDFGAGGVSVAIGELADGLFIDLDKVPLKYDGLDGTEIAISESQERMAVALDPNDVDEFLGYANEESLEATVVAKVTEEPRLQIAWRGNTIVDISREFLNSAGAEKHQDVHITKPETYKQNWSGNTLEEKLESVLTDLNVCSTKGLGQRFDSTIGASTVLMPYGGKTQLTPAYAMAAKLPVGCETTTVSGMSWGFNPYLMQKNPFVGAYSSVVESVSKLVASGFTHQKTYLTFQEYFERLRDVPERWGKPAAAVLGALMAQVDLEVASIGGKDSMSGSFEDIDVPPTLVSFATALGNTKNVISPEFKNTDSNVVLIKPYYQDQIRPKPQSLLNAMDLVQDLIESDLVSAVSTCTYGGLVEALFKMCVGNQIGLQVDPDIKQDNFFKPMYGSFVLELKDGVALDDSADFDVVQLGVTTKPYKLSMCGKVLDLETLQDKWEAKLEPVYPYKKEGMHVASITYNTPHIAHATTSIARPRVIIPVFPGTNCEYDTEVAFRRAGADPHTLVINNLSPSAVEESCHELVRQISKSQIIMLPGGFSGGDEPDGSAKFIASFFRNPEVTEAVRKLLNEQDGLILGICNGFQALVKLGPVPYGDIRDMDDTCPTLTYNQIARHQSGLVHTRIASNMSPWMSKCVPGEVYTIPISHGEGRFVASQQLVDRLAATGQICTQYTDSKGIPSMDLDVNPNGSIMAIEGICSPDGRVLGKMGHSERAGENLYKNVDGNKHQPIIEGGVSYFTE